MNQAAARPGVVLAPTAVAPAAMAVGLFGLSFGAVLFALAVFKLLSFFVMPSLFFDLLFIGFPIGALLGARLLPADLGSFRRSLWALQVLMAASVAACLAAKRFDYLRAHLFDVELGRLVGQVAAFAGLFLPFFAGYGLCEYLGYQVGRRHLGGRMRGVYALALFGAAAAYLALRGLLPALGMARILALAFAAVAAASWVLSGQLGRRAAVVELAALAAAMAVPGLEAGFLAVYKSHGVQSTWDYRQHLGCTPVFQRWGRYSLCEILAGPRRENYYGFYNDLFQWEYAPRLGFAGPSLGAVPILLTRPGEELAIVGAGGGRQVRLAEKLGGRRITAIELEPAVFEAVRGQDHLLRAFGRVYEAAGVTPVRSEARSFFERSDGRFDLIYLPSVGGYAQMMIEPGNMVRTAEAYRLMRDRLTPRGVLAIWYPRGLDDRGILTDQYVRTLRALGLRTAAYRNGLEYLILGLRGRSDEPPTAAELARLMALDPAVEGYATIAPRPYPVADDPRFTPITDDRPFLAGNVRHILAPAQVRQLAAGAAGVLALAGAATLAALRRRGDPRLPGRPFAAIAALAVLVGANFLLAEHLLVLALFRRLYVYDDALGLGAVAFLGLSGVGSLLAPRRLRTPLALLGLAGLAALIAWPGRLPVGAVVGLIAPAALASGTFFPALFDRAAANPLGVFALDAVGAGAGALAATFVPILWGFEALFGLAAALFGLTAAADAWFHRPVGLEPAGAGR